MATSSPGFMTCTLILETDSPGWHKSMIKVLSIIQGASYTLDAQQGYAYVSGKVDRGDFLTMLAKVAKHVQLYRIDYGQDRYWDNLRQRYSAEEYAPNELHAALPYAKSPEAQVQAANNHKHNKPSCCTVM